MQALKLFAELREDSGKGVARKLRRDGKIPAVLYGRGEVTISLVLNSDELSHLLAGGKATTNILKLQIGKDTKTSGKDVLIREIQRHPFREYIYHVDFQEIALDETLTVKVPVILVGESKGITMGGNLAFNRRELEVSCLPDSIPESITIDISDMDIGDSVHVESLEAPEGVTILHDVNFTILTIVGAAAEEEEEEEAIEDEESTEPEVISKGKEEEEGQED
ncbi:MAG TPA: 50S ribosomal protein L25/general stress protein Ctc [Proteobacteria bacterium]|nr:50S ribosomal protein L25 [bacterium BMS3Abin14]HDL53262.1 50S ribosomal protein L25/general stress protein Ctc [Pseudomonadota bacterium]